MKKLFNRVFHKSLSKEHKVVICLSSCFVWRLPYLALGLALKSWCIWKIFLLLFACWHYLQGFCVASNQFRHNVCKSPFPWRDVRIAHGWTEVQMFCRLRSFKGKLGHSSLFTKLWLNCSRFTHLKSLQFVFQTIILCLSYLCSFQFL